MDFQQMVNERFSGPAVLFQTLDEVSILRIAWRSTSGLPSLVFPALLEVRDELNIVSVSFEGPQKDFGRPMITLIPELADGDEEGEGTFIPSDFLRMGYANVEDMLYMNVMVDTPPMTIPMVDGAAGKAFYSWWTWAVAHLGTYGDWTGVDICIPKEWEPSWSTRPPEYLNRWWQGAW